MKGPPPRQDDLDRPGQQEASRPMRIPRLAFQPHSRSHNASSGGNDHSGKYSVCLIKANQYCGFERTSKNRGVLDLSWAIAELETLWVFVYYCGLRASVLGILNNSRKPIIKKTININTDSLILNIPSINPKKNVPITIPNFSNTS